MERKQARVIFVTDCGGSDRGRYEIAAGRCFFPHYLQTTFFETHSMNTLHAGFTTAAQALSTVDHFGPLEDGELVGILDNAAPRHGSENGESLRSARPREKRSTHSCSTLACGWWDQMRDSIFTSCSLVFSSLTSSQIHPVWSRHFVPWR